MKKRTLAILLIIPFIISLLTFVSIKILDNQVAVDILGISWDYQDNEGFQIDDKGYELKATPIIDSNLILANGNNLVWKTKKVHDSDEEFARIDEENGKFYLYALKEGEVEVICQNERGSKSKHFMATIFEDGAMVINPKRKGSSSNVSSTRYYGLYDYDGTGNKSKASFELTTTAYLEDGNRSSNNVLAEKSDNISYENGKVTLNSAGESYLTLEEPDHHYRATYTFTVIDGVNVYRYDDLLRATNQSKDGENAVLQVNLESLKNTYQKDAEGKYIDTKIEENRDNTELFGNYDFNNQCFSFDQEYYTFQTTYDSTYIDQYNKEKGASYKKDVIAGIHLKKDLYGNGFTINMNGLCYPNYGSIDKFTGKLVPKQKADDRDRQYDYFFGPLPFVSVGDMVSFPLVTALGQDNSGIYIDNDHVTIDDVKLSNVDEVDNLFNLSYTGSILDIKGKDVTVRNSVLSNGKVCVRAYDADNLLIDNCILKNSGEFTMLVGSDRKNTYDTSKTITEKSQSFASFYDDLSEERTDNANALLNSFLSATMNGGLKEKDYKSDLELVQKYLDNDTGLKSGNSVNYAATMRVKDTFFGRSGVFSLACESMFNGPLLYGGIPSMITSLLSMLSAPLPSKIGGTSAPVHVNLEGDTRFYDWKDIDSIDVSSLIEENISRTLNQMGYGDKSITIDDIFPMKAALKKQVKNKGLVYEKDGKSYLNTMVAYYGGGLNLSKVDNTLNDTYNTYSEATKVSLLDETIETNTGGGYSSLLTDCVIVTIGTHPFSFFTNGARESTAPILFDQVPSLDGLKQHAKEA